MKFRGRLNYVQFIATNRARFGIKFYKLFESLSDYCITFKIYVGRDEIQGSNASASEGIAMEVAQPVLNRGYALCMDNWYSSPQLFLNLLKIYMNAVGTVHKNRRICQRCLLLSS